MSIASAIQAKQQQVADSYTAVSNKGGTLPATQNLTNLATAIRSIPSGSTPTLIAKNITQNGTYNASSDNADGYSSVTVNVSGGGSISIPREVKNSVYQMPSESFTFSLPSDATDIGSYGLSYAFYGCTGLTSVDLSSLTTVSGSYSLYTAFRNCIGLTSVDLSSLTTVGDHSLYAAFQDCKNLTSIDLSSLTTVSNYGLSYTFQDCKNLTSVDLSSLTSIGSSYGLGYAFYGCAKLTSVDLSSLTSIGSNGLQSAFRNCTGLSDIYFRALTTTSFGTYKNQFNYMMQGTGTSKTHTLHFPSNMQSKISGLTGYPLFGGTSGYVILSFDLPATS